MTAVQPTVQPDRAQSATDPDWWRTAVIYQVYLRSFADGNGDGLGDIAGLRSKLPYLRDLGIDAIWINPWYPSPMADAGYDVSDYRDIDPRFGTLDDAKAVIDDAHALGLRVILDIVPNHTSDQHPWFQEALSAAPGSTERRRYIFRPGSGPHGDEPPNDWRSVFGGRAWERVTEPDGTPGEWYLHLFAPEQPDLNWEHPDVAADFETTLRFWFDLGADGFRIDVAHSMVKAEGLPDVGELVYDHTITLEQAADLDHPHWDRDEVHAIFRSWRAIADSYDPPRVFVAEAWVPHPERLAKYVRSDELHTAFNFEFLVVPWLANDLRRAIDNAIRSHAAVGAPPTWVLSNHDVIRHVSKYARVQTPDTPLRSVDELRGLPADLPTGVRRGRAAALLMLALPGGVYVYQGEELGLPEVEDLPEDALQDPTWLRSGHTERGRDGCRVPLPWSGSEPPYGFSPDGTSTWLPQPDDWAPLAADAQAGDPDSMLSLYRSALALRRSLHLAEPLEWLTCPEQTLLFRRGSGFTCMVNVSGAPVALPDGSTVLLSSSPLTDDGLLPTDTTAWCS
jgi:alpha-glucosidase